MPGPAFGREFVKLFVADGAQVLAVSLLQEELGELQRDLPAAGRHLSTLCMDLSEADAAERLLAWCQGQGFTVGTLINNAGFACFGEAVDQTVGRMASMIALNVTTLTKLAVLFGAQMEGAFVKAGFPTWDRLRGWCRIPIWRPTAPPRHT